MGAPLLKLSTADEARVNDARQILGQYAEGLDDQLFEAIASPAPGSTLEADLKSTWADPFTAAAVLLQGGADHLKTAAYVFARGRVPTFACYSLARVGLEAAAWALWLLKDGISDDERFSRYALLRIDNLKYQAKDDGNASHRDQQIDRVRASLAARGLQLVENDPRRGSPLRVENASGVRVTSPYSSKVVAAILGELSGAGTRASIKGYPFLSGVVHSQMFALLSSLDFVALTGSSVHHGFASADIPKICDCLNDAAQAHVFALNALRARAGRAPAAVQVF